MKEIIIKTEELCKSFIIGKTGTNVLKNLNIEIYKGDFAVIMGSSGSGKSTLLYALSTMDNPTSGKVELLSKEITSLKEKEVMEMRNKDISFIFQGINLLPDLTVYENIAYVAFKDKKNKEDGRERVKKTLEELGLWEDKDKYPSEISGGMQQRVAIGRAIVNEPTVLFGDEPTGSLNSSMGQIVLDLLTELNNKGQSVVMVTHDVNAAIRGNRLLYIKDGRIDGELSLENYSEDDKANRKMKVKEFLDKKGW